MREGKKGVEIAFNYKPFGWLVRPWVDFRVNGFHIYKYRVVTRNFRILLVVAEILIWGILFNTSKNKTKKLLTKQKSKI